MNTGENSPPPDLSEKRSPLPTSTKPPPNLPEGRRMVKRLMS